MARAKKVLTEIGLSSPTFQARRAGGTDDPGDGVRRRLETSGDAQDADPGRVQLPDPRALGPGRLPDRGRPCAVARGTARPDHTACWFAAPLGPPCLAARAAHICCTSAEGLRDFLPGPHRLVRLPLRGAGRTRGMRAADG